MHRTVIGLTLILASFGAHAALLGRLPVTPGGTDYQAYYDTVLHITWVADANLSRTSGYDADGLMTWTEAGTWITSLAVARYLGVRNWRLPKVTDTGTPLCDYAYTGTDCGYNVDLATGEMAHMFYSTLANMGLYDTSGNATGCSGTCLTNAGPFSNLQPSVYWSGTLYRRTFVPIRTYAWLFDYAIGRQYFGFAGGEFGAGGEEHRAWAVRYGDIGVNAPDTDSDTVPDDVDNCTLVANPTQLDADGDGNGNACDADLNNDGSVDFADLALFRTVFGTVNANADFNGNGGIVNFADLAIFRSLFGKPPGPSGLAQ